MKFVQSGFVLAEEALVEQRVAGGPSAEENLCSGFYQNKGVLGGGGGGSLRRVRRD